MQWKTGLAAAGVVTVLAGSGAVLAHAAGTTSKTAAPGGLMVSPSSIQRTAQAGATNMVAVTNYSDKALAITVAARPWTQSTTGTVAADRRHTLATVSVSDPSFTLAPGATRQLTVTQKSGTPTYGSVDVIGLPTDAATRKGLVLGYRILETLRYTPTTAVHTFKVGAAKITDKVLTIAVQNTGNTVDPVTGTIAVKGPLGTKQGSIKSTRILPGKSVALPTSAKSLAKGRYTATIQLTQGTTKVTLTKKISVK